MSDQRAILIGPDHRWAADTAEHVPSGERPLSEIVERYDAAGDQPRTRWCVPHGRVASNASGTLCPKTSGTNPCRVMDALVVPLVGDADTKSTT